MGENTELNKPDKTITGFSKLSKRGKIKWLVENFFKDPESVMRELMSYWHTNEDQQKVLDGFSENTISNFYLPYGVAPNFVINDHPYCIPMVTEESSVVAAASNAAKFWMNRGGFRAEVISTLKSGQVHFIWNGDKEKLNANFSKIKEYLISQAKPYTSNMERRGGGVVDIFLKDYTSNTPGYYQLDCTFETCDSMGANFINTILEGFAKSLKEYFERHDEFSVREFPIEIIMSILSNYTPECIVRASVECSLQDIALPALNIDGPTFGRRFHTAVNIAHLDPHRATTHNKGIFNGIDAVVLATGNDFRAIEACGHTYACKDGQYKSLSHCTIDGNTFKFWLEIPLAVGTIGGLTSLHPIAKRSLELLDNPSAKELMKIIAVTGLAQNFAAIKSLVTTGIQKGHMKMHLLNILNRHGATEDEIKEAVLHFKDKVVSFGAVKEFLDFCRNNNPEKRILA